jgi:hypothetical protein
VIGCGSFIFTSLEPRPVLVRGFSWGRSGPQRTAPTMSLSLRHTFLHTAGMQRQGRHGGRPLAAGLSLARRWPTLQPLLKFIALHVRLPTGKIGRAQLSGHLLGYRSPDCLRTCRIAHALLYLSAKTALATLGSLRALTRHQCLEKIGFPRTKVERKLQRSNRGSACDLDFRRRPTMRPRKDRARTLNTTMMSFSMRVIVRPPRPQPALYICVPAAYRIEWPQNDRTKHVRDH